MYKALIILHAMIRNGAVENVLSHVAQDEVGQQLKILAGRSSGHGSASRVSSASSSSLSRRASLKFGAHIVTASDFAPPADSGSVPRIVRSYASYLDDRVRAYKELRHDVIRSSDSARSGGGTGSNRLRRLVVEKGLLREVGITQKVGNSAVQCDVSGTRAGGI